MDAIEKF
jgi:ATP-dependent RNA helicase DDX27